MSALTLQCLGWHDHPYWPVWHNLRRALASLRGGERAVLLLRSRLRRMYRHALLPTDFSPSSLDGLRRAIRALPPMRFTLLHTCRVAGEGSMRMAGVGDDVLDACRQRKERAARAAGHRYAAQLAPFDTSVSVLVLRQPWAAAVASHAALARPDLLVLIETSGGPCEAWRWRTNLRALLGRTDCDLLLLPRAKCAASGGRFVT